MILSVTNTTKLLITFELSKYQAFKKCKQISITLKMLCKLLCVNEIAKICFITCFAVNHCCFYREFLLAILVDNS